MPVLLAGREPDHITGPDFLDRSAFALRPAAARRDDERLTELMRMPCRPRARLENAGALNKSRIGRLKWWIDSDRSSEPLGRTLAGGLRANSFDLHDRNRIKRSIPVAARQIALPHKCSPVRRDSLSPRHCAFAKGFGY